MVEFALVFPLFLGVILLIFEGARFMMVYTSLANGTNHGARLASITTNTNADVNTAVQNMVAPVNPGPVTVTVDRSTPGRVAVVTTSQFTFNPAFFTLLNMVNVGTVNIQHRASMTSEPTWP